MICLLLVSIHEKQKQRKEDLRQENHKVATEIQWIIWWDNLKVAAKTEG